MAEVTRNCNCIETNIALRSHLTGAFVSDFSCKKENQGHRLRPYLSMHPKSLDRAVDQASQGLICDTASLRATSEHVRHCCNNQREKITMNLSRGMCALQSIDPHKSLSFNKIVQQASPHGVAYFLDLLTFLANHGENWTTVQ